MVSETYKTKMELKRLHHRQKELKEEVKNLKRLRDTTLNKLNKNCIKVSDGYRSNDYILDTTVYNYLYYDKKFKKANKNLLKQKMKINILKGYLEMYRYTVEAIYDDE